VLANLLGNVRAHTPPGTPAAVRLRAEGAGAVIEVTDQGRACRSATRRWPSTLPPRRGRARRAGARVCPPVRVCCGS
jgi:hypothetical protein